MELCKEELGASASLLVRQLLERLTGAPCPSCAACPIRLDVPLRREAIPLDVAV